MIKWLIPLALLMGCEGDETLYNYGAADKAWRLSRIGTETFAANAVLRFEKAGDVTGTAPCNTFSARQTAPYPWFELGAIAATKRACPDLSAERRFFAVLARMTLSEIVGDKLILSTPDGPEMVFVAEKDHSR